jgi:hypothetical protein
MFRLNIFHKKHTGGLSESQGVPPGTFQCDVCRFVQPVAGLCGTVRDEAGSPPGVYKLCGCCSLWLGLGTSRFQPGLLFAFSDKQRTKIEALHQEFDSLGSFEGISKKISELAEQNVVNIRDTDDPDRNFEKVHRYLETNPNLRRLIKFRFSFLPGDYRDICDRLTRGEPVEPREIKKANK